MTTVELLRMDSPASEVRVPPRVRVLLADPDPISRRVLSSLLGQAPELRLVSSLDSHANMGNWPLFDVDVVVLCVNSQDDLFKALAPLTAADLKVLLLGTSWDHERVGTAFALGAKGCLVKDSLPSNLASGACAVNANHCVLTPELLDLCLKPLAAVASRSASTLGACVDNSVRIASLTTREREVLMWIAAGRSTEEVAAAFTVSCSTVKSHISRSLTKLGVRNRLEAVLLMQAAGAKASAAG